MAGPELYAEIFQETSTGDFGIQIKNGPLFRCHTRILETAAPGIIGKTRSFGKCGIRTVDAQAENIPDSKDYFKEHGLTRLADDVGFQRFSMDPRRSAMKSDAAGLLSKPKVDPQAPSFTTSTVLSGNTAAVRRRDPYFLAERYEVDCDTERMCELLRWAYRGESAYFDIRPETDKENNILTHKMLNLCYDAEKYSVDSLFEKLLHWFGKVCFNRCGERCFADAFYHLQHHEQRCTEEHSREAMVQTVTGEMLAPRNQFRTVTRDPRWASLPPSFIEHTLKFDGLPIGSEIEILNLIERWNAYADKPQGDIIQLLCCFRPDQSTLPTLKSWLTGMGWLGDDCGHIPGIERIGRLLSGIDAPFAPKPRRNLKGQELLEVEHQLEEEEKAEEAEKEKSKSTFMAADPTSSKVEQNAEACFLLYRGGTLVTKGFSFKLAAQQKLCQNHPIRSSGRSRLRVTLMDSSKELWDPEHEVFVGISYGEGKYFGYLCSATAFSGIFCCRALSSAAPAAAPPIHLTGSGNKVEFDCALEVQLVRVNFVIQCKLGIIWKNETVAEELFQVAHETLKDGPGLRYQVIATGLEDEGAVDVQLGWVSGGDKDEAVEEEAVEVHDAW